MAVVIIAAVAAWQLGAFRTVQAPSVAGVAVDRETANASETFTFTAEAKDPMGGTLTYAWDFGDGTNTTTTANTVRHAYSLPGNFIVLLTVKSSASGQTATNDGNLTYVTVNKPIPAPVNPPAKGGTPPAPAAVGAVSNNNPAPGTPVTFVANASWQWVWTPENASSPYAQLNGTWDQDTSAIKTYTWNFGDGSPAVTGNLTQAGTANHTYTRAGNWFAKLTVASASGTGEFGITVRAAPPVPVTGVRNPGVFNSVEFGGPQYLDPATDYETAGGEVIQNVYETPLFYNGSSATDLIPLLATKVPSVQDGLISSDGLTVTFPIRANVKFHNGDTLTLDDVVYSWKRPFIIHDPNSAYWMMDLALFNYMFVNHLGKSTDGYLTDLTTSMRAINASYQPPQWLTSALAGHATIDQAAAMAVLDAAIVKDSHAPLPGSIGNVTVRFVRPYPAFLKIAAFTVMSVVDARVAQPGDSWGNHNSYMDNNAMGTGPYRLRAWVKGQVIILDRFDGYWRGPAKIRQVNIYNVQDVTTRELMLFSGQADYSAVPRNKIQDLLNKPGVRLDRGQPTFTIDAIFMNQNFSQDTTIDKFSNIPRDFFAGPPGSPGWHVRRAFSYAFDYNAYLNNVLRGTGQRLNGPIPQGMFGFKNETLFQLNLDQARAELQAAGWLSKGFSITIFYNCGNAVRQQAAQLLATNLKALGPNIDAQAQCLDWPTYLDAAGHLHLPVFIIGWLPDYADPDDYVVPFLHGVAGTYPLWTGYNNASLNRLIEKAAVTVDPVQRQALYNEIQDIAYSVDTPYIWLDQLTSFQPFRDWVHGTTFNPMFSNLYYYALSKGR